MIRSKHVIITICIGILWLIYLFAPQLVFLALWINLSILLIHQVLQICFYTKSQRVLHPKASGQPFISIHIPVCNEPSDIVIKTIQSCLDQNYRNFEVIVFDNNTPNRKNWIPVEQFCAQHKNVNFFQSNHFKGFKAGALQFCRTKSNPSTDYIFTVDADYSIAPDCLTKATAYLNSPDIGLIQFPQSYSNITKRLSGLAWELDHYFKIYSVGANRYNIALPTGTLSLINIKALDEAGGWSDSSITEDAELGIRLHQFNYRQFFIPLKLGKGILPASSRNLIRQRNRWIYGNFQVLLGLWQNRGLSTFKKIIASIQLSAWINFLGFPSLILIVMSLSNFFGYSNEQQIIDVVTYQFIGYLGLKLILFGIAAHFKPKVWLSSWINHIALTSLGAFDWWMVFLRRPKAFGKTDKFLKRSLPNLRTLRIPILLTLSSSILFQSTGSPIELIFLSICIIFLIACLYFHSQFQPSMKRSIPKFSKL